MAVWWLAIDRQYTSYTELKHRKIIAQGWPKLGDLTGICPLVTSGNRAEFVAVVSCLENITSGVTTHAAEVIWNMLNMANGDLIVGIEGTVVKGICQLEQNGWESYRLLFPEVYEYANTIGFPVIWHDWNSKIFGPPPTPPGQSVQGIAGLRNEAQRIENTWQNFCS